jgi:hypothetical protein
MLMQISSAQYAIFGSGSMKTVLKEKSKPKFSDWSVLGIYLEL